MRIDFDTPVDLIAHSADIDYIDLDEVELMHCKYIKKTKRSNGKWRYYYDVNAAAKNLNGKTKKNAAATSNYIKAGYYFVKDIMNSRVMKVGQTIKNLDAIWSYAKQRAGIDD